MRFRTLSVTQGGVLLVSDSSRVVIAIATTDLFCCQLPAPSPPFTIHYLLLTSIYRATVLRKG